MTSNRLQYESSPYLKQHQHNPVDWYPWGEESLQRAKAENKLLVVSIGYAACHWCHVMERESFENEQVAQLMNEHFVSIKVDREERPDIDQLYMTAVQLMTDQGGWPLNCICLPDGRPIYGGTYFRPHDWMQVLEQLHQLWAQEPETALDYAARLEQGIRESERLVIHRIPEQYSAQDVQEIVAPWKARFDQEFGGYARAPKFPLPNNWLFFLRYGALTGDKEVLDHTHFTLRRMALGGIYDQLGGGFSRYSVDREWHIPHFEKMLYDNAQLVSLYVEAYRQRPEPLYQQVVGETLAWVQREMTSPEGGFYCALDADSEGVEGKFYTFDRQEIQQVLGADAPLFMACFGITEKGNWEEEQTNVLKMDEDAAKLAAEAGFDLLTWRTYLREMKDRLLAYREKRVRPGLDDKTLTSWNALMLKAFVDAYRLFDQEEYLHQALKNADFIERHLQTEEGDLLHQRADNRVIKAFLDDYAFLIEAYIGLYEATFDIQWLRRAKERADEAIAHFYDEQGGGFYYTSDLEKVLITRKAELLDNVMPSSNSVMCHQLYKLGLIFDAPHYTEIVLQILGNVFPQIKSYGSAYSNWSLLLLQEVYGLNEVVITGPASLLFRKEIDQYAIPNKLLVGGQTENLPILSGRITQENLFYLCKNKVCSLPVDNIADLKELIFKQEI